MVHSKKEDAIHEIEIHRSFCGRLCGSVHGSSRAYMA